MRDKIITLSIGFILIILISLMYRGCTKDIPTGTIYRPLVMGNDNSRDSIIISNTKFTYQVYQVYWRRIAGGFKPFQCVGYRRVKDEITNVVR
jgi:hypothetical protein